MPSRAKDWLAQAERDLDHARISADAKQHEWACFAAHQAAEKALKALHYARGEEAWGHVVRQLLDGLGAPEKLIQKGQVLDTYYVPTRYPNGHASGAPFEYYGVLQSSEAIRYAGEIIEYARLQMAGA